MSDEQKREEQEEQKQRSGAGLFVKWALLVVIGLPVAWFAFCEARKAYWDWRVTQMCEKDGGVIVYQTIQLSDSEYKNLGGSYGAIPVPERRSSEDAPYVSDTTITNIRESNPRVARWESTIFRRADDIQLGKLVTYARVGGDFPTGIAHQSSFSCRNLNIRLDIERQIFNVDGRR